MKLVEDNAFSRIFSYLRSLGYFPTPMHFLSKVGTCPKDIAVLFNQFFHSVLSCSSDLNLTCDTSFEPQGCLSSIELDPIAKYQALASLDQSKAMGHDNISPKVLKFCASALFEPVTYLFQLCLDVGQIPADWKLHVITPLFKSGDRSSISNYRPISLLCIISKVLEKLVFDHIIDFLSTNIINHSQFGFLRGKSTVQHDSC